MGRKSKNEYLNYDQRAQKDLKWIGDCIKDQKGKHYGYFYNK